MRWYPLPYYLPSEVECQKQLSRSHFPAILQVNVRGLTYILKAVSKESNHSSNLASHLTLCSTISHSSSTTYAPGYETNFHASELTAYTKTPTTRDSVVAGIIPWFYGATETLDSTLYQPYLNFMTRAAWTGNLESSWNVAGAYTRSTRRG